MVYLIALIDSLRQKSISADDYVVFAEISYFAFRIRCIRSLVKLSISLARFLGF